MANSNSLNGTIFDKHKPSYEKASENMDVFFENLYIQESLEINDVKLVNRDGQSMFALNIMDALRKKEILLINAGTGIGKSIGYLIPIFYAIDGVNKFNRVMISTSTIALQQQLLTSIHNVSKILDIDIKVEIAKGMNNYFCINNVKKLLYLSSTLSEEERTLILELEAESRKLKTADKNELSKFNNEIWEQIKLTNRAICSNCSYSKMCYFALHEKQIKNANIVVTNHSNFAYQLNRINQKEIEELNYDAYIIDEAHKLPESQIAVNNDEIKYDDLIYSLESIVGIDEIDYAYLIIAIKKMLYAIKDNAYGICKKTEKTISYDSTTRYSFNVVNDVKLNVERAKNLIEIFLNRLDRQRISKKASNIKSIENVRNIKCLLSDMLLENKKNIYWAYFNKNDFVSIGYTPKINTANYEKIYDKDVPIVFTSGTLLDASGEYDYFIKEVRLDNPKYFPRINQERPIDSPYDFENNSLVYYNPNMPDPSETINKSYEKNSYLISLANEINKLITITNGKSLILFTSKNDMESVYSILKTFDYPFDILIQHDNNTSEVHQKFIDNTDSCLLATGTFWEGIDIKGASLSNLIITHLPFSVPEPVIQYRAKKEEKDVRFEKVYLNDMLQKMAQGMGRLIRSYNDTGIICILDPRFKKYIDNVKNATPFKNFTTSLEDVENFTNEKIHKKR